MPWGKKLKLFLFMYLILVLICSSVNSASEAFCFESSNNDSLGSSGCFSVISNIDWLTGEILTLKKANGHLNSLLRNRLLRIFTFAGIISAGIIFIAVYLVGVKQKTVNNDNIPLIKNLVIVNLRI
jgi:hypothetical protein